MVKAWTVRNPLRGHPGLGGSEGPQGVPGPAGAQGPQGLQGATGPQGAQGDTGTQGIQGPVGLTGPKGDTGAQGIQGPVGMTGPKGDEGTPGATGPAGPATAGQPNPRSPAFATAYQATDATKPSFISAMIDTAYNVTVVGTQADTVELRIGPIAAQVAAGTGGFVAATFRSSITGIALAIGLGVGQRSQVSALLPSGWWWAIRRTQGSNATITSATDQSLG